MKLKMVAGELMKNGIDPSTIIHLQQLILLIVFESKILLNRAGPHPSNYKFTQNTLIPEKFPTSM